MTAKAPGSVNWAALGIDIDLVEEAQFILITGWTHEQYETAPLDVIDAVMQVHSAQEEIKTSQWKRKR